MHYHASAEDRFTIPLPLYAMDDMPYQRSYQWYGGHPVQHADRSGRDGTPRQRSAAAPSSRERRGTPPSLSHAAGRSMLYRPRAYEPTSGRHQEERSSQDIFRHLCAAVDRASRMDGSDEEGGTEIKRRRHSSAFSQRSLQLENATPTRQRRPIPSQQEKRLPFATGPQKSPGRVSNRTLARSGSGSTLRSPKGSSSLFQQGDAVGKGRPPFNTRCLVDSTKQQSDTLSEDSEVLRRRQARCQARGDEDRGGRGLSPLRPRPRMHLNYYEQQAQWPYAAAAPFHLNEPTDDSISYPVWVRDTTAPFGFSQRSHSSSRDYQHYSPKRASPPRASSVQMVRRAGPSEFYSSSLAARGIPAGRSTQPRSSPRYHNASPNVAAALRWR